MTDELTRDVQLFLLLLKSAVKECNLYWEITADGDFIFSRGNKKMVMKKEKLVKYFSDEI